MIRDNAVIDLLKWNNALLDALLVGVHITRNSFGRADVQLDFKARPDSDFSEICLRFIEVVEFEFDYERQSAFLDICALKFLRLNDDSFYISLDPDPWTLPEAGVTDVRASDTDKFYVRARGIEASVTKRAITLTDDKT